ncbi:CLUAP1 [Lepeophtheirus salmonis]|uniref:CLUAP1 n=2 Tax=Lepeophtheirus salmonis TaxID=72036 RepID=A0A7R8H5K6_LEPSM|nr:CLUAP1 [Lepeophtheirus salmonis]CAF2882284.1 CLUAP1 [Lepeophtheirus salmonis]
MSFRDLRNLTEMMRSLGYPRLISLENFRNPNFPLVAEILIWLVHRFDPQSDLPTDLDTEQDRVMFVRSVIQFMATKAQVKLNSKKLYQADGHSVKEIIKITTILYKAININDRNGNFDKEEFSIPTLDVGSKLYELKQTRELGSQITKTGAKLYDLLGKEIHLREKRMQVLSKQLEITQVEKGLKACVKGVEDDIKQTNQNIENVASNEANLDTKIEKKSVELERNQKRLITLKKVRPAFMDEYEKLEKELKKLYEEYITKFRSLAYLEQQLEEYDRVEQEQMEERQIATKKILEKMKNEENLASFERDITSSEDEDDIDDDDDDILPKNGSNGALKSTSTNRPSGPTTRRVYGSMISGAAEDDGEDDSLGSESDILLDGDGLDDSNEDDSDELEINELASESLRNRKSAKLKPSLQRLPSRGSDEDF